MKNNLAPKACIFDLDGTLLETLSQISYYLNETLKKYGIDEIEIEKVKEFVGSGAKNLISRALGYRGKSEDEEPALYSEFYKDYLELYNADIEFMVKPYEGITESLNIIKSKGIKLAVLSNKPHSSVNPMIDKFFPDLFDIAEGAMDGVPLKPDPTPLLSVCERLGVNPTETLYFGDSDVDMITGKAYGAGITVGVSWGFRSSEVLQENGADLLLDDPIQVAELVNKLTVS